MTDIYRYELVAKEQQAKEQNEVVVLLQHLNADEPSIQFTVERETDGKLPFLDTCVQKITDGKLETVV